MATAAKKTTAKKAVAAAPKVKAPPRPVVEAKSTEEGAQEYRVTGRIRIDGLVLRPAASGRDADTVELTERQAFGLRGFVEPVEALDQSGEPQD